MCGIVGYIGDRDISSVLIVGLERLSYRGYDSAGIATLSESELSCWKKTGKIHELSRFIDKLSIKGQLGIGHTRWATHGPTTEINAHPHVCGNGKKIAIVHNGIIENYASIKSDLQKKGYIFRSQTDSEVIGHLIAYYYKTEDSLLSAIKQCISKLQGTYSVAVISELDPNKIICFRKGSPLIIGLGSNENFVSSDINSIINHTKDVVYLEDSQIAIIEKSTVDILNESGKSVDFKVNHVEWDPNTSEKSGYDHFMLKEIYEQPHVIRKILSKYVSNNTIQFNHIDNSKIGLDSVRRFIIQACGTSWHSGLIGKYYIEKYARILTEVDISSEFRYRQMISHGNDLVLAISQSGETADTLACLREAKSKFFKVLSFVNVKNSSIDRESDGVIYSYSGQEIGVASTKNYLSQLLCMFLFSIYLGQTRGILSDKEYSDMITSVNRLPEYLEKILQNADKIKTISDKYYLSREFLFIGRGYNYPSALEGALKLKEISYIHATGYAAGELKHGPIALIDSKLPVVCVCPQTETYDKMISNIHEVISRKGKTIIIATEGDTRVKEFSDDIIYVPKAPDYLTPMLVSIPMQLLAYYIAINLDCDVDQPRNLAKSVTVE
ncbi:glutamine--fructose-6-phosphate transaminase (isomerizing) [Candidatus Marinamargulisbacteria bacterium SCGC AG-410-N11]|nr:glutamine--fructose-6-phosphate transaminase (isomerizing) [Candidatus Marinamargulisbacteria bacterium SCGC AG-410-N11]